MLTAASEVSEGERDGLRQFDGLSQRQSARSEFGIDLAHQSVGSARLEESGRHERCRTDPAKSSFRWTEKLNDLPIEWSGQ